MKQILIIAQNTLRETIRDRILYSILGFSIMVIAASLLAGSVSLDQDIRVIQNFSLMSVLIFMLVITVFLGSQMMFREIERKTIYITLSKPVSREQFYLGKFFGLTATVSLAVLTMSIVFMSVLYFKGYREFSSIVWAVIFMLFEVPILVAVSRSRRSPSPRAASSIPRASSESVRGPVSPDRGARRPFRSLEP